MMVYIMTKIKIDNLLFDNDGIYNDKNKNKFNFNLISDEKEFDLLIKNIIKEYNSENEIILDNDITPQMVINLLQGMEKNIINALELRDLTIKELDRDKKQYENILEDLKLKVEQNKRELNILFQDINIVYNLTTPKKDMKELKETSENYIISLNKELSKYIKDKNCIKTENICLDTFRLLHLLQDKFYNAYNELNQITEKDENSEIFKEAIDKIKIENKREKQKEKKSLEIKSLIKKNKKLQQRMLRYKTKGPITVPPPWALNQSKKKKIIKIDVNAENEEILFYQ